MDTPLKSLKKNCSGCTVNPTSPAERVLTVCPNDFAISYPIRVAPILGKLRPPDATITFFATTLPLLLKSQNGYQSYLLSELLYLKDMFYMNILL